MSTVARLIHLLRKLRSIARWLMNAYVGYTKGPRMKLIRIEYHKVTKGSLDYFIKCRMYLSKYDGQIKREFITEDTYLENLQMRVHRKPVKFLEYEYHAAELGIKNLIDKGRW